jgi:diphosphomevalonate decarboxylase
MYPGTATARACANIAFIKYWGDLDPCLRVPVNSSLSMNLAGLHTHTTVTFDDALPQDQLLLEGSPAPEAARQRVSLMLDAVRQLTGKTIFARVESANNFPMGAGIASSASAFAALALAASTAAGLTLSEQELSRLARCGSGSACRSIPAGFVEWQAGTRDEDSYAFTIAAPDHWDLVDLVALTSHAHKPVGSTEGHTLAATSPIQAARVADAPRRLEMCRTAICERNFAAFAEVVEQDCNLMHAVMMTSSQRLIYWLPATLAVMRAVQSWRQDGLDVCYTIDAGPNVHVLCLAASAPQIQTRLAALPGVEKILAAPPGGPARLIPA